MAECDPWVKIDVAGNDCKEWDSLSHVCWILDTGAWTDTCFWRDLSLWRDGPEPWVGVAA